MNQPNISQMVQRYALLLAGSERARAQGLPIPPRVANEMNRLYSRAQSMLTPVEQQQAMNAVNTLKAQHHQRMDIQASVKDANAKRYFQDQTAKELTGMTVDQLNEARHGRKVPVKGSDYKPDRVKESVERQFKQFGMPMNFKQFRKLAADVEDMKLHGRNTDAYLKDKFGGKWTLVKDVMDDYDAQGVELRLGLAEKRGVAKDTLRQPSEEEQRKAQLAHAWATSATRDEDSRDAIVKSYDTAYLEDDGIQGDVARAMLQVEMKENGSPADYEGENYDQEELAHATN